MSDPYPPDWDTRRRQVYQNDDYECQNCGVMGGEGVQSDDIELHAHHIVPISKGGTHDMSNLKTLCVSCHDAVHNKNSYAPTADRPSQSNNTWINVADENNSSTIYAAVIVTVVFGLLAGGPAGAILAGLIVGIVMTVFYSLF